MFDRVNIFTDKPSASQSTGCSLLWLVVLNVGTFWPHYLGTTTVPYDFRAIYYPLESFWIHLIQNGIFPHWAPYQTMGLPFLMTMQSGIFYPPLWVFAIPGFFEYNLHAANIVQALHVLWGAIGFWIYARRLGLGYGAALFGATAFHFFGGFYSNASAPDMIRAFAWLPWLFWVVYIADHQQKLLMRNWLAPLVIYFFITGAYIGNIMSQGFFLIIACVLSWIRQINRQQSLLRLTTKLYVQLACLCVLGFGLASLFLFPTLAMKPLMERGAGWFGFRANWPWSFWGTLLMPAFAKNIYFLRTMLSAFVTLPVFCLLFMGGKDFFRQQWLWIVMTVLALAMAGGDGSMLYHLLTSAFSYLNYSRFPSSDYRGVFCFGIILLSATILNGCTEAFILLRVRRAAWCCCGLLAFYCLFLALQAGLDSSQGRVDEFVASHAEISRVIYIVLLVISRTFLSGEPREWYIALMLAIVVFFMIYHFKKNRKLLIVSLLSLQCISGFYTIYRDKDDWQLEDDSQAGNIEDALHAELGIQGQPSIMKAVNNPLPSRPACLDENSWRGYLDGNSTCVSPGAVDSKVRSIVYSMPPLKKYLYQPWRAISLSPNDRKTCDAEQLIAHGTEEKSVQQISYGLQDVRYAVKASENFCFVENELSFPGWRAKIVDTGKTVYPSSYCNALRVWCLPNGQYEVEASYRTPGLREGVMVSVMCLLIYSVLVVVRIRRLPLSTSLP